MPATIVLSAYPGRCTPGGRELALSIGVAVPQRRVEVTDHVSVIEAVAVTLHEILRLGRFFAFAAGNSETRTDSSLEFAANVRMPDERRRAV